MLITSLFHWKWHEKDSLWIEIPIERNPSLCDKTIHSEILVSQKKEVPLIMKNMPHVEKTLFNVIPNSLFWNPK